MTKHIIISTIRNAYKHKVLSFTKLLGISLSFLVVLLAVSYVRYETSFDNFFKDKDRIFRVYMDGTMTGHAFNAAVTSAPMGRAARTQIPEIADAITLKTQGSRIFTVNSKDLIEEDGFVIADTNFLSFFDIQVIASSQNPLYAKNSIIMCESLAKKLFGNSNKALNQCVKMKNGDKFDDYFVTAIFDDLPYNSHLKITAVTNISFHKSFNDNWDMQMFYTYIKTKTADINQQ